MAKRNEVIRGLEMSYIYSNVDEDNTLVPQQIVLDAIALLLAQGPVEPIERNGFYYCGKCRRAFTVHKQKYCADCGKAVKWE